MSSTAESASLWGTKINRKDYGLTYNQITEAIAVVADEVNVSVDLTAIRVPNGPVIRPQRQAAPARPAGTTP